MSEAWDWRYIGPVLTVSKKLTITDDISHEPPAERKACSDKFVGMLNTELIIIKNIIASTFKNCRFAPFSVAIGGCGSNNVTLEGNAVAFAKYVNSAILAEIPTSCPSIISAKLNFESAADSDSAHTTHVANIIESSDCWIIVDPYLLIHEPISVPKCNGDRATYTWISGNDLLGYDPGTSWGFQLSADNAFIDVYSGGDSVPIGRYELRSLDTPTLDSISMKNGQKLRKIEYASADDEGNDLQSSDIFIDEYYAPIDEPSFD